MRKVALVIMDGVGITKDTYGNAFLNANTPNLDYLMNNYPNIQLKAHGTAVGLPSDDDMGNSEVGHNALGCGQIYSQGAKLVNESINNRELFNSETWKLLINNAKDKTLHFIGLLSDGNVHSNINHLLKMLDETKKENIKRVRIHILLDGRDVEERSALKYIKILEDKLNEINKDEYDYKIASGGGRMKITMDRYEANWSMVELGYRTHVFGEGRMFENATKAIETLYSESNVIDQDLDPFVIGKDKPIGRINENDSVILFNFRGDRAIEISKSFEDNNFDKFNFKRPKVLFAGLLQYDSDLKIPKYYLTEPPKITNTLTETLVMNNINEYAISETQKYGHVTYFWNGNKVDKINENLETWEKIPSDNISFDKKPEMKAYEITNKFIEAIKSSKYQFLRLNFPNGDMVGHTGNYEASIKAMEVVDECIGKIFNNIDDTILVIIADHGNCEEMYQKPKKDKDISKTSHTLNPVPFIICNKNITFKDGSFGLANVASTICDLLNVKSNSKWKKSTIK